MTCSAAVRKVTERIIVSTASSLATASMTSVVGLYGVPAKGSKPVSSTGRSGKQKGSAVPSVSACWRKERRGVLLLCCFLLGLVFEESLIHCSIFFRFMPEVLTDPLKRARCICFPASTCSDSLNLSQKRAEWNARFLY